MVTFGVRRILVISFVASWVLSPSSQASDTTSTFRRIRVLEPCLKTLVEDAAAQSSIVRTLVATINRSDLIVYVRCTAFKNASLAGRLAFVSAVAGQRYLAIELKFPEQWNAQVATIGHELQHAVEIAGTPWIRNQETMAQYYRQTGIIVSKKPPIFDTDAARRIGQLVKQELPAPAPAHESDKMRGPRDFRSPH